MTWNQWKAKDWERKVRLGSTRTSPAYRVDSSRGNHAVRAMPTEA